MRKAIIRYDKKGVTILCNRGHLIERYNFADMIFAGSQLEADLAYVEYDRRNTGTSRFDRLAEKCQGAGH